MMNIRRFNEGFNSNESIFTSQDLLKEMLLPISKYETSIHYKMFIISPETHLLEPFGPQSKLNFSDNFWKETVENLGLNIEENGFSLGSRRKRLIYGCIVDIIDANKMFTNTAADEQRLGRVFSNFTDDLIPALENIDRIKYDCETEGYDLSIFLSNSGFNKATNFNSNSKISILILDNF